MTIDKTKHDCPNCSAFGIHCPHRVNGDPYYYDCAMTVEELEKQNVELIGKVAFLENDLNNAKAQIEKMKCCGNCKHHRYTYGELECVTKGCKNKDKWKYKE